MSRIDFVKKVHAATQHLDTGLCLQRDGVVTLSFFVSSTESIVGRRHERLKLGARTLACVLGTDECLKAGSPHTWEHGGVTVRARVNAWNGSFHASQVGVQTVVARHAHLGKARRAIRAYLKEFGTTTTQEKFRLRRMVRSGD